MVKLDQTYYVGSRPKQQVPTSLSDLDMGDIACVVLTFAAWVALFMRYGFGVQGIVFVVLVTLLMAAGICDKKASVVPLPIPAAMAVLFIATVWFMPYGLGPILTAPGAGGLTSLFAGWLGAGWLPVLIDGVLAVPVMLVISGVVILIVGVITGSESLSGSVIRLLLALSLFLGVTGALLMAVLSLACYGVMLVAGMLLGGRSNDTLSSPMLYAGSYGQLGGSSSSVSAALPVAFAVMILLIFL